ncbi:DNA phosphorothioation-associated putative methyltransferase [Fischerella sp. PCC 9605]|uniref:DNA phosphorothioation-associated putative methyltransferase n=1 Tax=Fischerella sp. PCC 9605 TaxID=1173024 RepID=UPI00047D0F33|nr:DNA phosphorothioation-associated putative methyltransferase [Fischerella sp. PCC 9605]
MSDKSYLAAPTRKYLSATAKIMLKRQLLNIDETHLDYGCGKGGDVERLTAAGYKSTGYDPYYFPNSAIAPADVVTMSYVLNVIADPLERREALRRAWSFTKKRLIVSANVRGAGNSPEQITKWGTFAKYYSHVELKAYIESVLGFEAERLEKDKFLIRRDGRQFTPLHYDEVLAKSEAIASFGWIAPLHTIIKRYRSGSSFHYHYRLLCKYRHLPGEKKVMHIRGGLNSEDMQWAIASLQRRNKILQMKFHCIEQKFLHEFSGCKDFSFLEESIKIYN